MKFSLLKKVIILAFVLFCGLANGASVDDLMMSFQASQGEYMVASCDESATGSLTVPAEYNGYPVTLIAGTAFYNCSGLTEIILPNSIEQIVGNNAFMGCDSLETFIMPTDSPITVINEYTFRDCAALTNVTLGDNIQTIDRFLKSLKYSSSNKKSWIYWAYQCCNL